MSEDNVQGTLRNTTSKTALNAPQITWLQFVNDFQQENKSWQHTNTSRRFNYLKSTEKNLGN